MMNKIENTDFKNDGVAEFCKPNFKAKISFNSAFNMFSVKISDEKFFIRELEDVKRLMYSIDESNGNFYFGKIDSESFRGDIVLFPSLNKRIIISRGVLNVFMKSNDFVKSEKPVFMNEHSIVFKETSFHMIDGLLYQVNEVGFGFYSGNRDYSKMIWNDLRSSKQRNNRGLRSPLFFYKKPLNPLRRNENEKRKEHAERRDG